MEATEKLPRQAKLLNQLIMKAMADDAASEKGMPKSVSFSLADLAQALGCNVSEVKRSLHYLSSAEPPQHMKDTIAKMARELKRARIANVTSSDDTTITFEPSPCSVDDQN